jgi:hypothetical protein
LLGFPLLILGFTILLLLEAILLRRLIPGIKALRDSIIMNITTIVLGGILTFVFYDPIDSFLYEQSEFGVFFFLILTALVLSIFVESGILKVIEAKSSFTQIVGAATIANLASYAVLGITFGLFYWGYDLADDYESVGYLLLFGVPIALFALFIRLWRVNSAATPLMEIPKDTESEPISSEGYGKAPPDSEQTSASDPDRQEDSPPRPPKP